MRATAGAPWPDRIRARSDRLCRAGERASQVPRIDPSPVPPLLETREHLASDDEGRRCSPRCISFVTVAPKIVGKLAIHASAYGALDCGCTVGGRDGGGSPTGAAVPPSGSDDRERAAGVRGGPADLRAADPALSGSYRGIQPEGPHAACGS